MPKDRVRLCTHFGAVRHLELCEYLALPILRAGNLTPPTLPERRDPHRLEVDVAAQVQRGLAQLRGAVVDPTTERLGSPLPRLPPSLHVDRRAEPVVCHEKRLRHVGLSLLSLSLSLTAEPLCTVNDCERFRLRATQAERWRGRRRHHRRRRALW